jgi:hypothetical protein
MLPHLRLKFLLMPSLDNHRANIAATFEHPHNDGLVFAASAGDDAGFLALMHVPSLAADESLVHFDFSREASAGNVVLHGEADAVAHEPCGLLCNAEGPVKFPGAIPVLAVGNHPSGCEPFVQADRGVFEDGSDLDGELPLGMLRGTLPTEMLGLVVDLGAPTGRAYDTLRPTTRDEVVDAVLWISKVDDGLLKGLGFVGHN